MDEAIQKLARLMNLPIHALKLEAVPEPLHRKGEDEPLQESEDTYVDEIPPPAFARGDVSSMFDAALSVETTDPEQALFLYEQVLENDPDFMDGQIKGFVQDKRDDLKLARLEILTERIDSAKKQGSWTETIQIGKSMTDIDPTNEFAFQQIKAAERNAQYEPYYKRAIGASEDENQEAANNLMTYIHRNAPGYGDPAGLLTNQPITRDLVSFLRNTHTLVGHNSPITDITFSIDGEVLATASADHSVKLWSISSGKQIADSNQHDGPVNAISFSQDGMFLASGSSDRTIILWNAETLELVALAKTGSQINDLAFSRDSKTLATAGKYGSLQLHQVPNIQTYDSANLGHDSMDLEITGIVFSTGKNLYSSVRKRRMHSRETFFDYSIGVWNFASKGNADFRVSPVQDHMDYTVHKLSISTDNKYLASVGNGLITVWQLPQGSEYWHYFCESQNGYGSSLNGDAEFLPSDQALMVVALGEDELGRLHFLDLTQREMICAINVHEEAVNCIAVSSDGRYLATGSQDRLVKIWQL